MPVLALQVHGATVEVQAPRPVLESLEHLFHPFVGPSTPGAIPLHVQVGPAPSEWPGGRLLSEVASTVGRCRLYRGDGHRSAVFEDLATFVVPAEGPARLWLREAEPQEWDAALSFAVSELVKERGIYSMHAGAVAHRGRGVLIPGVSGTGKSTSTAALVLAGFDYLSDDQPFFRVGEDGPQLLSFPAPLKLSDQSQRRLATRTGGDADADDYKHAVPAIEGLGATTVDSARPELLLFLQLRDIEGCVARPILRTHALSRLLPHALCTFDVELSRAQFQDLAALVRATRAYEVDMGPDPRALGPAVLDLLDARG